MPVHIDRIDSEIEIVPSVAGAEPASRGAAPVAPTAVARAEFRREVVRALGDELDEYLRSRG